MTRLNLYGWEIITDYTDTLDRRLRNGEESDTLKTGIEELDAITGGMNAEDPVIIAARPGMGKTELALKIAEGVASRVILVLTSGAGY